ncbi:hypothetical protein PG994_002683 [Apiospora phragmitis]|uniref:NAD(P)-binding protein n=1 Tax=Apiospora phragmitis TaxID=2905665 RepID=A0ABR1W8L6_9PEZI
MDVTGYAFRYRRGAAASGIGKASCYALAEEGVSGVLVADLNLDGAKETAEAIKAIATHSEFRAEAIHLDVAQEESVKRAISHMISLFGRVDYSVHCAGIPGGTFGPIAAANFSDFKHLLEVNVHGTFLVTSLISAAMKSQDPKPVHQKHPERGLSRGVIVNLASVSSYISVPCMMQYTTSKHAVLGITKTAGTSFSYTTPIAYFHANLFKAIDNIEHGIRVNCVCPTWTDTPMVQRAMEVVPG